MKMQRREVLGSMGLAATGLVAGPATESQAQQNSGSGSSARGGQEPFFDPVRNFHLYLCGFHTAKANPEFQIEVQHYCHVGEDLHQCVIFHRTEKDSKLLGVEYIITNDLYQSLPAEEKKYWHPHSYEVMSGQLVAPGMPANEEQALMKKLINTWGKTWHTWPNPETQLPVGDPLLMWALTGDGQIEEQLINNRDERLDVSTENARARRKEAFDLPVPQVAQPESVQFIGRQWTNEDPDTPEHRREQPG